MRGPVAEVEGPRRAGLEGVAAPADVVEVQHRAAVDGLLHGAGVPLADNAPVITDDPIWLAETAHVTALALPQESPDAVLALARHFGSKLLIVAQTNGDGEWPAVLDSGGSGTQCFREVLLTDNSGKYPLEGSPLYRIRAFRIVCS